ncbi:MAG TPA: potassium transporter Trk [Microbacterium sp.]|nr:potassium transporter Trk [Microbacterium sp.]
MNQASPVTVRRSPKYGVFTAIGVALGLVAALILTFAFTGTSEPSPFTEVRYSQSQTFGFIMLWCVPAGIAIMLVLAMILDRTIGGRTRRVNVVREVTDETGARD